MDHPDKIIYSISIEDVQTVAGKELNRKLTYEELSLVRDRLAEHINWYHAILFAIRDMSPEIVDSS
jgi:hypothetical protein